MAARTAILPHDLANSLNVVGETPNRVSIFKFPMTSGFASPSFLIQNVADNFVHESPPGGDEIHD